MVWHCRGGAPISVHQCSFCKWIDFDDIGEQLISMTPMLDVNFGCGEFKAPEPWINIDHHAPYEPDVLANVFKLPPFIRGIQRAYCGHFLEHIPEGKVTEALIHIRDRMLTGGTIVVVGPDVNRAYQMYLENLISKEEYEHTLTSPPSHKPEWSGDVHHWDCNEQRVADFLSRAGFQAVTPTPIYSTLLNPYPVTARVGWQCAVMALNL